MSVISLHLQEVSAIKNFLTISFLCSVLQRYLYNKKVVNPQVYARLSQLTFKIIL